MMEPGRFHCLLSMLWVSRPNCFHMNLILVGALCVIFVQSARLPEFVKVCHRSDPNLEQCILNSIEIFRPYLKKGVPEMDMPAFEPFFLNQIEVPGGLGSNSLLATGKNIKIHGATDFKVDKLKLDLSNQERPSGVLSVTIPYLELNGDYVVDTKILGFPISGNGPITFNTSNTKADIVLYGQIYKKENYNYLTFTKMDISLKIDDYNIHLGNLFNGDKMLGEITNLAINENKKALIEIISPLLSKTISKTALKLANKVTRNQPYDILFPM